MQKHRRQKYSMILLQQIEIKWVIGWKTFKDNYRIQIVTQKDLEGIRKIDLFQTRNKVDKKDGYFNVKCKKHGEYHTKKHLMEHLKEDCHKLQGE
ncbi:unnamed protein product [Paramecium sonneborni]|uniref:Uncharacterized protein n=1 Tax=Paramecium sonneborni TaxID=65129 RepID=A0A8S1NVN5_9CILI|nr:unnamed protein product [Paramecium sonneborni]